MRRIAGWMVLMSVLLAGCATYQAARLPSSDIASMTQSADQDGLKAGVKFFDARESQQIFGVGKVYERFQPVYLVIDNRSKDVYEFKKRDLNKTSTPAEEVAKICGFNTVARATTYGVAGLFIWPLLIPAVVDGVGSSNANQKMQADFAYKEIPDERVAVNGLLNGVVFLEKIKEGEELVIRLRNVQTNEIKLFSFKR